MNKRIQKLIYELNNQVGVQWANQDKLKFAELIVQECAMLVQGVPTDTTGYHTADQKIKEHFGVE